MDEGSGGRCWMGGQRRVALAFKAYMVSAERSRDAREHSGLASKALTYR